MQENLKICFENIKNLRATLNTKLKTDDYLNTREEYEQIQNNARQIKDNIWNFLNLESV